MIREAMQSILNELVDSYSPSVNSDSMPETPFLVHESRVTDPLRDKEGICAINHELGIMLVGDSDEQIDPLFIQIVQTLEAYNDNEIEQCSFISDQGLQYDNELLKYTRQFTFRIETVNTLNQ